MDDTGQSAPREPRLSFPRHNTRRSLTGSFHASDSQRYARRLRRVSFGARVDRRARPRARPRRRDARGLRQHQDGTRRSDRRRFAQGRAVVAPRVRRRRGTRRRAGHRPRVRVGVPRPPGGRLPRVRGRAERPAEQLPRGVRGVRLVSERRRDALRRALGLFRRARGRHAARRRGGHGPERARRRPGVVPHRRQGLLAGQTERVHLRRGVRRVQRIRLSANRLRRASARRDGFRRRSRRKNADVRFRASSVGRRRGCERAVRGAGPAENRHVVSVVRRRRSVFP